MCSFLLLLSLSLSSLNSSLVVEIEGNKSFTDREILHTLNILEFSPSNNMNLNEFAQKILNLYKNAGYLTTEVTFKAQNKILYVRISEGTLFKIAKISIKGNKFIKDDNLLKLLAIKENQPFQEIDFDNSINEILVFYGNRGFPFTKVVPSSFRIDESRLKIGLEVQEGPRLKWGETIVSGNTVTKAYVIRKQMRIPVGMYFSEEKLSSSHSWLEKLAFIESANNLSLIRGEQSGTVSVLATVREKKSNSISGIIGYIPDEETVNKGFIGSFSALFLNLFGTARLLNIRWEKNTLMYTKLEVSYTEPWILNSYSSATLSLSHFIEDTLYSFSKANLELETDITLNISLAIVSGWEHFIPASISIPESRKYTVGSNIVFSNLDYVPNPSRGLNYSFYTEYGRKTSKNIMKFTIRLLNVIPIFSTNAISVLLSGKAIRTNSPPLPEYEQFTLGGYNSLRGYRERQFRTTKMLRFSPEFSYFVSKKSRLYLFYDSAYFETSNYETETTKNYFKDAYGVGAKLSSRIGIVSIEYALGEERTLMKGKIHLGLDTAF